MLSSRKPILSTMEPNVNHVADRPVGRKASVQRRLPPSPLKKQSDYELVAPLATKALVSSNPPPLAPSAAANARASDPTTPKIKNERKKYLCATPPSVLQDVRGQKEYDRGRQLGEGGFARCFLVENKEGGLFAAKTVSKKSLVNEKMKRKFFGELQVHRTMIHPNIVRFIEVFEDEENIYMILELCQNKSLMDMLRRRKRFTEPEVRYFLLQLLGALKYMHGKNVIHRDLKLGNIFLDKNMNIKIGDFGLAALLMDENERKKTICGTPNYIAPEVLFNSGKDGNGHSFEVDLWAVGVIMYAMLVGKPPFQSTDIDSIYRKIQSNSFDWPEDLKISLSAKSLVTSLLSRDPGARPSLDDIANHNFFRTGMFPRSIPSLATKQEPSWASTGHSAATASAGRMEWKRSYDDVARAAGVGIDSTGKPITPVGDGAGKPLEIFPMSRPASVASSREEKNFEVVKAPVGKRGRERDLKDEAIKKSSGFVLPETLSPRDGHARMRNVGVLKKVPSRLGRLRESALSQKTRARDAQAVIVEESDGEENPETSPDAVPEPPKMRLMDQKPIRFASGETKEAAGSSSTTVPTARTNLIPARRVTRSYAAEQRVAAAIPEAHRQTDTANKPAAAGIHPVGSATVPTTETRLSSQESTSDKPRGPEKIELGSFCQSSVGKPIRETTTTAVLLSLQSIVSNLTAFMSDNMDSLPPTPESTIRAVRAYRAGEKNRAVFIQKWVDYTNKYGMAYMLSDGTRATLFNDNTSLVFDGIAGELVEWITCSFIDPPQTVRGYKEFVYRRLMTDINVIRGRSNGSRSLKSKWTIWKRTNNYMDSCLDMMAENSSCDRKDAVREPSMELQGNQANLLWITHYARLRKCTIFRLIDGTMQFNFTDRTKLILTSSGRTLRLITAGHGLHVLSLEDAYQLCRDSETFVTEFGLKQRMSYIKEILRIWHNTGRFPTDFDAKQGEAKTYVALGEGPPERV